MAEVALVLNERLSGLTLREIRASLSERVSDRRSEAETGELLNIFIQEAEQLFDLRFSASERRVVLGQASMLAEQPEFSSGANLRKLLALTERTDALGELLGRHDSRQGISITIGTEHGDPALADFTVVTTEYHIGSLAGVIGVIGPTRMPYDKVITLVTHTSRLISELLD